MRNPILILLILFSAFIQAQEKYQLSSHILDISQGKPAPNVKIALSKQDKNQNWVLIDEKYTDNNGRIKDFLKEESNKNNNGVYKLTFYITPYFEKLKQNIHILKITFHGSDDETRYRLIREKVINRLDEIGFPRFKANKIFSNLQNEFKNNASKRIALTIKDLGWLIILYSINIEESTVYELFDIPKINEISLKTDFSDLILNKSLDFEFVTSVTTEFNKFSLSCTTRRDMVENFIKVYYNRFKNDILNLNGKISSHLLDDLTKVILFQILSSHSDIDSVRRGLNI